MTRQEIANYLGVSIRSVSRYRGLTGWPQLETTNSLKNWAIEVGLWDPVVERRIGLANVKNSKCRNGKHEMNELNTYRAPDGSRICRACRRAGYAAFMARHAKAVA